MQQLIAAMKRYGLQSLVDCRIKLSIRGPDAKSKTWFIQLLFAPGMNKGGQFPGH